MGGMVTNDTAVQTVNIIIIIIIRSSSSSGSTGRLPLIVPRRV